MNLAKNQPADINIIVFGYNYAKFWIERLTKLGKFFGYNYRIKGKFIGIGYNKSVCFNEDIHEIKNNIRLYNHCFDTSIESINYKIPGWKPERNLVIMGISTKREKTMPLAIWQKLFIEITKLGFKVKTVDLDIGLDHVKTPTIEDLKNELSNATYYIGTDSGVAHLADILGIPSLIMFGSTSIVKNKPFNRKSIVISRELKCSPCFDWGRINCHINYECMNFEVNHILKNFNELVIKTD